MRGAGNEVQASIFSKKRRTSLVPKRSVQNTGANGVRKSTSLYSATLNQAEVNYIC